MEPAKHLFRPAAPRDNLPQLPQTPPRSSLADAMHRFAKNKASVTAVIIIGFLLLFSLLTPLFSHYTVGFRDGFYRTMPPIFAQRRILSGPQAVLDYHTAIGAELGKSAVRSIKNRTPNEDTGRAFYSLSVDAYDKVGFQYVDMSRGDFEALQAYQNATGRQVCYPLPKNYTAFYPAVSSSANLWYQLADHSTYSTGESAHHASDGTPILLPNYLTAEPDGSYASLRMENDPGNWVYGAKNQTGYRCRVLYSAYYQYKNGFSPRHILGTNQHGQDILVSLASGARLSFLLAAGVSVLNLLIGVCYGAVEGYYGGKLDLTMERVSDILAAIPFIVVATLFQLHLAQRVGAVPSLLFSFVLTGWIGIASRVRSQFYRFKNAEYVLCSRTLGASDGRIIFRHILPNAIGTIITSAVLLIPGVIFSESMLSYLGIVNLESANMTSIGTMLSSGRQYLSTYPHILAFPAIFIALLEISFNLLGNGLRDAFNPILRGSEE
jgi:oligopeptide transport system permease protein